MSKKEFQSSMAIRWKWKLARASKFPSAIAWTPKKRLLSQKDLQDFKVSKFLYDRWNNPDGSWNGKQQAEDVYRMLNFEKILQKTASEAANRRLEAYLKEQRNVDFSGGRQQPIRHQRRPTGRDGKFLL
jgi:hypothetical protein